MNPRSINNSNNNDSNDSMGEDDRLKEPPFDRVRKGREKEKDGEMMTEYSSSTLDNFLSISSSSSSALSSSLYSSMKLPTACLNERDGCDEAELIARAKRCEEILKLSKQAAIAEAERVRIANIKPLVWAKPTFDIDSITADTAAAAEETQAEEKLGKRKERQEEEETKKETKNDSSYHGDRLFSKPRRTSTPEEEEEVQTIVDFTSKWVPSPKRKASIETEEETEEEELKCDGAASISS
mmetsp:Transcript_16/g.24  ORF Transcript_16/g.24 Transcript_16/m.24 type:complete len:240 (+) Transcript_16:48-767(+)